MLDGNKKERRLDTTRSRRNSKRVSFILIELVFWLTILMAILMLELSAFAVAWRIIDLR